MTQIGNEKENIRRRMLELRCQLPLQEKLNADKKIAAAVLQQSEIIKARTISIFFSKSEETGTEQILIELFRMRKIVTAPKIANQELALYRITSIHDVVSGPFGIKEPRTSFQNIPASEIDVFIVPGIAFDRSGNRLGWGKGYYDRLLKNVTNPRIGLAYSRQLVPHIPHEPYDIVMTEIITENEVINPVIPAKAGIYR